MRDKRETKDNIRWGVGSKFAKSILIPLYAIFILLIVVIIITIRNTMGKDIRGNVIAEKKAQLTYVENHISKRMEELNSVFYSIGEDPVFFIEKTVSRVNLGYHMVENLRRYSSSNGFASHLAYYQLSNPDQFCSSAGLMSVSVFLRAVLKCSDRYAEPMLEKIRETAGMECYPMSFGEEPFEYLMLVNSYPRFSQHPRSFAVAFVNRSALQGIADALFVDGRGEFVILSPDRSVIYRGGSVEGLFEALPADYWMKMTGEDRFKTIAGEEYLIQSLYNDRFGWSFISMLNVSDIMGKMNRNDMLLYLFMAILLLFAATVVMIVVLEKYKPVKRLALTVSDRLDIGDKLSDRYDEQTLLTVAFTSLLEDTASHYKEMFFTNLLAGQYDESSILNAMQEYGISFQNPFYTVMIIYIGDECADQAAIHRICGSIDAWFGRKSQQCCVLYQKSVECVAVFLNYSDISSDYSHERAVVTDLQRYLEEDLGVRSYIGVGMAYFSPLQWAVSYREANNAMYCCRMNEHGRCMLYTEIEKSNLTEDFLLYHVKLKDACKKGDEIEASSIMHQLKELYYHRRISEIQVKYLFYHVITSILEYSEDVEVIEKTKNVLFRLLGNREPFIQLFDEGVALYLTAVKEQKAINSSRDGQKQEMIRRILEITDAHLFDRLLSLESLAAHCGISPSYLNRLFRQELACTPMNYVENARMTQVKQRLRETDDPIKVIVEQVGYIDQSNFIRKFRRAEGMTPTAYRKLFR